MYNNGWKSEKGSENYYSIERERERKRAFPHNRSKQVRNRKRKNTFHG